MKNYIKYLLTITLMLFVINAEAQGLDDIIGFDDDVNDTSSVPINFLIPIAIMIGVAIGIKKLK